MKMERTSVSISATVIYCAFTIAVLFGCYNSYSVGVGNDARDDSDNENIGMPKTNGYEDNTDTPDTNGGNGGNGGTQPPITEDDNRSTGRPVPNGGDDGIGPPVPNGDDDGIDTPTTNGDDGINDTPDTSASDRGIVPPKGPESNVVQLQPGSDWTAGNFLTRNDARWFTLDVVSGNIYHIYLDDEYGSGRHYGEGELFIYEGEPTDVDAYFDYVDVYSEEPYDHDGFYLKPYNYKANFTGTLYVLFVSDNPGYQTFEIRFDVN
jgi:hypothetical protein